MICMQATVEVAHENLPEFMDVLANRMVPLFAKHGVGLVGSWMTVIGILDEITDLWAVDSMEHYEKAMRSLMKDPEWRETYDRIRSLIKHESIKILRPLAFSPLK